jgi:hypothetical protein
MTHRTEQSNDSDLKQREYRDAQGDVHHHTHPYMEEHGAEHRPEHPTRSGSEPRHDEGVEHSGHGARPLTDHDEIRSWAEHRGAQPSCVKGTGSKGDVGMIRLDFPGYSGADSLQAISWDEWFKAFEENGLALLVQDETAGGQESHFNKLVSRSGGKKRSNSH